MELSHRTDAALLELARTGSAPAFAAILHRHAAVVHRSVAHTGDPMSAVRATFLDAMKQLGSLDGDVATALQDLAEAHGGVRNPGTSADRDLTEEQVDGIWSTLAPRWPSGRSRRQLPQVVPWLVLVALLIGVGFAVPRLVLTSGDESPDEELEQLIARPYEEQNEEPTDREDEVEDPGIPLLPIPDENGADLSDDGGSTEPDGDVATAGRP